MLHVHRSERADPLAEALAALLSVPAGDAFAPELVAVPTRGMERWLSQRLAARLGASPGRGDGVCANVAFPPPGVILAEALALAGGVTPEADPWPAARLVWPLIEVVESCLEEPWLAPLARHLESGRARRFARVRGVAQLFDEYALRRPAMVQAWARGELGGDDAGAWQRQLWLRLRERLGVPSPAERLPGACERLRDEPEVVELPERLALFGLTRLPGAHLELLRALAAGREVHLMLLHPSPALWAAVAADPSARAGSRLLASWGREARDLQVVLGDVGPLADHHHPTGEPTRPGTLLAAIQADVRDDRQPPGEPLAGARERRLRLAADDDSIRIHSCHGRARQVEVLREAILHRLAEDDTLEPRDVIVMCPDVETFAPLIEASFGEREADAEPDAGTADGKLELRVRLADRSLRQTNPVLGVTARVLELAEGRLTASEVLDLADRGPVRARFGFDDDDLAKLREWVAAAEIHWGLDADHRADYQLGEVTTGTWSFGLRRLLLGVAIGESGQPLFDRMLPVDDVPSGQIELVGRLAELVDRLGWAVRALRQPQTIAGWTQALLSVARLLTAVLEPDAWQQRELDRIVAELADEAAHGPGALELTLPEVRALLADRLRGRPTRANFRTGQLTVCTLMPMRSVPHRVVCLLGLDDGVFPRQSAHDGDDLLLADPQPGDRDPRTEDRQLLLDALMAAREALLVTYSGNDERTNAPRPPAVPVGELLDTIDATAYWQEGDRRCRARERVRVAHPLQGFDPANFVAGRLVGSEPWSFDPTALAGARALVGPRAAPEPFLAGPLPAPSDLRLLSLRDLIAFVEHPVRAFLRQRLGISLAAGEDDVEDSLPLELHGLAAWSVGQRLLDGLLAGGELGTLARAEIARGSLPPDELGRPGLAQAWHEAEALAAVAAGHGAASEPRSLETNISLADGTRLTGTVSGVRGHVALTVSYSRLAARHRLAAWVRLLALTAAHPETPFQSVTIGRRGDSVESDGTDGPADPEAHVVVASVPPLAADPRRRSELALRELARLCELYRVGMCEPLALASETTAAYASAALGGGDPEQAAAAAWRTGWRDGHWHHGEDRDREYARVLGEELELSAMQTHAVALWRPLLARERVELA